MLIPNIQTPDQVTDAQVDYLAGITQSLSRQSDFDIQNFADSGLTSPDVQQAFQSYADKNLLGDIGNGNATAMRMALNFHQEAVASNLSFWDRLKAWFTGLRTKVITIFCKVLAELGNDKDLDLKTILKQVIVVLIPALAATAGLVPLALSIVVSLGAMLLKYGASQVCPA